MRAIALAALLTLLAAGCGDAATDWTAIDAADAGRTVTLGHADYLEVRLAGDISTGYSWEILEFDDDVLRLVDGPGYESGSGGGVFTFEFQCVGAGTTDVELGYMRPWEDSPPLDTWSVTVVAS